MLSDEQIKAIGGEAFGIDIAFDGHLMHFARAIESAACAERDNRIAELERELEQARRQMERQKDEWLSWEAKRKALESAVVELEAVRKDSGWQPIETAPKDGTLFLCWVSAVRYGETDEGQPYAQDVSQADFCNWRTQADVPDCGWFDPCCGQIGDSQAVTHWMPLPPAPAMKEQK